MAKNTFKSVSGYLWSQEKNKWLMNTKSIFQIAAIVHINAKLLRSATRLWVSQWLGQDTVSEESEDDEINGGEHSPVNATLWFDAVVHDSVPVLPC